MHTQVHTYTYVHKRKQELPIGLPVSKKFGKKILHGVIVSTDVDPKGKTLWHIKYENNDGEDLYGNECRAVACLHHTLR